MFGARRAPTTKFPGLATVQQGVRKNWADVDFGWIFNTEASSFSSDTAVLIADSTDLATEFAPVFFFRLLAANIPGLQRFAFEIKPKGNPRLRRFASGI